eukprot:NODE_1970_length_1021_cov_57.070988_g1602_i0.p2 GENE.NODE_1970_length_1021_cov_57.070988_g1602_i0~~NODE_1970_length_1021_cov_57.070988_g1602_i0.p2  ORF type:complete len:175 (+),score=33.97 NODE_1970_length_1021_cov_57.070988_g1602_i0:425-949(+)
MGYRFGGPRTCDSIMRNFCTNDWLINVGRLAIVVALLMGFPTIQMPCRDALLSLMHPRRSEVVVNEEFVVKSDCFMLVERMSATLITVLTALVVACLVPGVSVVWTFVGSTISIMVGFIIPSFMYLKLRNERRWNIRKTVALMLCIIGPPVSMMSLIQAISHFGVDTCKGPISC